MSTRIPVTVEGNLTNEPETGVGDNGTEWTRFSVAVNDRRLNETTQQWESGDTVFHRVVAFGAQGRHVAESLHKGDAVVVAGDLKFGNFTDTKTGEVRETRQIVANNVGASLKYTNVQIASNSPKARGPEAYATGPVVTPEAQSSVGVAR